MKVINKSVAALQLGTVVLCILALSGCLDGSESDSEVTILPSLGVDFPNFSQTLSTNGSYLDVAGIALGTTSSAIPLSVEYSLNDQALTPDMNPSLPLDAFLYWRADGPDLLQAGLNVLDISAVAPSGETQSTLYMVRGSQYVREVALQYHVTGSQWYVLDAAQKALLQVAYPDPALDDLVVKTVFSSAVSGAGAGLAFGKPIDFAIDEGAGRAIVVDQDRDTLIAVDLSTGDRSELALQGVTLQGPVAIDIDTSSQYAYILDREARAIVEVRLDADGVDDGLAAVISSPDMPACSSVSGQAIPSCNDLQQFGNVDNCDLGTDADTDDCDSWFRLEKPFDLVYQSIGGLERLFVTDFRANEGGMIAIVELAGGDNVKGARTVLETPEVRDDDDDTSSIRINRYGRLALDAANNRLMAIIFDIPDVTGFAEQGVLTIDVSNDYGNPALNPPEFGEEGRQFFLSVNAYEDNDGIQVDVDDFNFFGHPEALAMADSRLLVLDTWLGVTVDVNLIDADPNDDLLTEGDRRFLAGGAVISGSRGEGNEEQYGPLVSGAVGAFVWDLDAGISGGSGFLALDNATNSLVDLAINGDGVVTRRIQASSELSADDCGTADDCTDYELIRQTLFQNPKSLSINPMTSGIIIADAGSDRILEESSSNVRTVLSDVQSGNNTIVLQNPLAQAFFDNGENDSPAHVRELYVLDAGAADIVTVNLTDEAEIDNNRSALGLACLTNPSAMLLHIDNSDLDNNPDTVDYVRRLLIAERNLPEIKIVELDNNNNCDTVTYSGNTNFGSMNVVDIKPDLRSYGNAEATVLLLDRDDGEILSLETDFEAPDLIAHPVTGANKPDTNTSNPLIGANRMAVSSVGERIFVLDDIINSIYVVDLAARDDDTGERIPQDFSSISGQRYVISRGVSMSCDPADFVDLGACDFSEE